jgi:hypothetical protein
MASKNAPAVPRRRYADFCNKIRQQRSFHNRSLRKQAAAPICALGARVQNAPAVGFDWKARSNELSDGKASRRQIT